MKLSEMIERLTLIAQQHGGDHPVELLIDFDEKGQWQATANGLAVSSNDGKVGYVVIVHEPSWAPG